jgi:hypothetical protein
MAGGDLLFMYFRSRRRAATSNRTDTIYWHGWNPNNKEVCFVAQRGTKIYNLYKQPINGGSRSATHIFNKRAMLMAPNIPRMENTFITMPIPRVPCRSGG